MRDDEAEFEFDLDCTRSVIYGCAMCLPFWIGLGVLIWWAL